MGNEFKRGEIYWIDLGKDTSNSMQAKIRPCIIVANDKSTKYSPVFQVVPTSTKIKKINLPTHIFVKKNKMNGLRSNSIALCESVDNIPVKSIYSKIGKLSTREMKEVNRCLAIQLGLDKQKDNKVDNVKLRKMVKSIIELKKYIEQKDSKNNSLIESLNLQKSMLNEYCERYNVDIDRIYSSKLSFLNNSSLIGF